MLAHGSVKLVLKIILKQQPCPTHQEQAIDRFGDLFRVKPFRLRGNTGDVGEHHSGLLTRACRTRHSLS